MAAAGKLAAGHFLEKIHMMPSVEEAEKESRLWEPTAALRFYRPAHGTDNDIRLEQLWKRFTGETAWRPVQTILED